jgi:DNA-binding transcriptional LysR family regulator
VFPRYLVASPAYLARRGTPRVPDDLLQHDCLHYRFPSSGKLEPWPLPVTPGAAPVELPVSMVSNTIEARLAFALAGRGIAYIPEHSVRQALDEGRLQRVMADQIHACGTFHLLWPSGRHVLPKLRVFIDFISARLTGVSC